MNKPEAPLNVMTEAEMVERMQQQQEIERLKLELQQRMESTREDDAWNALINAYRFLQKAKPETRSEEARRYAVAITKMEDVLSWFNSMIIEEGFE